MGKPAISLTEIAWAAGFLEGEGSFIYTKSRTTLVSVTQVQREPLERLHRMFGGSICGPLQPSGNSRQPYYSWQLTGPRARGLAFTVFTLMSPRRRAQITKMIGGWRGVVAAAA